MGIASEIFGVRPERKHLVEYWKKSLSKLWYIPKQEKNWKVAFKEDKREFILFVLTFMMLVLFGAWFGVNKVKSKKKNDAPVQKYAGYLYPEFQGFVCDVLTARSRIHPRFG